MSVIDILTRVDSICKKYDKYDVEKNRDSNVSGDDPFARLYSSVDADIEALLQKAETASKEKGKASAVAINAEIRRTKARLLEEVPKLQRLAVKMILDAIEQVGGIYVVTADHGNAEDMVKRDKSGKPIVGKDGKVQILTSHTLEPVPIAIGGPGLAPGVRFRNDVPAGGLANVAATVMNLHGFEAPSDYETTLIEVADK